MPAGHISNSLTLLLIWLGMEKHMVTGIWRHTCCSDEIAPSDRTIYALFPHAQLYTKGRPSRERGSVKGVLTLPVSLCLLQKSDWYPLPFWRSRNIFIPKRLEARWSPGGKALLWQPFHNHSFFAPSATALIKLTCLVALDMSPALTLTV